MAPKAAEPWTRARKGQPGYKQRPSGRYKETTVAGRLATKQSNRAAAAALLALAADEGPARECSLALAAARSPTSARRLLALVTRMQSARAPGCAPGAAALVASLKVARARARSRTPPTPGAGGRDGRDGRDGPPTPAASAVTPLDGPDGACPGAPEEEAHASPDVEEVLFWRGHEVKEGQTWIICADLTFAADEELPECFDEEDDDAAPVVIDGVYKHLGEWAVDFTYVYKPDVSEVRQDVQRLAILQGSTVQMAAMNEKKSLTEDDSEWF